MQILSSGISTLQIQNPLKIHSIPSLIRNTNPCLSISVNPSNNNNVNTNNKKFTLKCRNSEYFEQQDKNSSKAFNTFSPPPVLGDLPPRVYVGHSIYKGKAALTIDPQAPELTPLDSGAFKLSKEGMVLLQFAPASGVRQYDWNRKQLFSLSVVEMAAVMNLGPKDSLEFFHDPFKGRSEEGKIKKILKAEPLPDGSGHIFRLHVQNKLLNVDESIYIPITKAELTVIVSAFNFILPYLLGWHTFVNSVKLSDKNRGNNNINPRSSYGSQVDYEWSK